MATAQGLARVAAINKSIAESPTASQGYVAASNNPTQAAMEGGAYNNPHDAPTYSPTNDPTTKQYNPNAPKPNIQPITAADLQGNTNTSIPNPQTATIAPPNASNPDLANAIAGKGSALTSAEMASSDTIAQYAKRYQQGLANVKASGLQASDTSGAASNAIKASLPAATQTAPTTTSNVDSHFDPNANPNLQQSTQDIIDFISPPAVRNDLYSIMSKIQGQQDVLSSEQMQLTNLNNIMGGTSDDIRSEIQATGGLGTDSQVMALATARNKTLLKQATYLQDQMQYQQSLIANNTQLMNFEKDMANTQATQRMGILQYQQTAQNNIQNAARDTYKTLMTANPQGLYDSLMANPQQAANFQAITGATPDMLKGMASTAQTEAAMKSAQLSGLLLDNKKKAADLSSAGSDTTQQKLEQQYRQILVKEVQSRSGTLGTEDAKVAQANHLASLMNQYYDANTGNYNVPKAQYGELVLGLAGMISKTGTPTDSQTENILQKTAKGDLAGAISYVMGSTPTGTTQAVLKNLADSIDRQAETAVNNRQAAINLLHGLAPTDLDQSRRDALEKNTLVGYTGINSKSKQALTPLKSGATGTLSSGLTWTIK